MSGSSTQTWTFAAFFLVLAEALATTNTARLAIASAMSARTVDLRKTLFKIVSLVGLTGGQYRAKLPNSALASQVCDVKEVQWDRLGPMKTSLGIWAFGAHGDAVQSGRLQARAGRRLDRQQGAHAPSKGSAT